MQNLCVFKSSKILHTNIHSLSSLREKGSFLSRIRYVLNHYWIGSKLLYDNYKTAREIRKKDVNSLTRLDYLTLEQYRYDIRIGAPFVLLFAMPIIGYSAPLLALIAPKYLPSTLIMPKQKVEFLKDDANVSSSIIDSLIKLSKRQYDSEKIHDFISIIQFINKISSANDRFESIMSSIEETSSLFNRNLNLSSIERQHLLLVHQSILHSSFISKYLLNNYSIIKQIENWQNRIFNDDQILIKNINKLSRYELVLSLYSRGIYLHLNEMANVLKYEQINHFNRIEKKKTEIIELSENILNDWKQILYQWIKIHKSISKRNQISTSFLVHIGPLLTKK
ncbi:unnamed protein product [Rotaria socialis]|uniref:Letm1 RBD domain-containing protein n=1 Tax=Rotaria socialis TaxID=392032 RepID=A0A820JEW2_9BILA|nr:unnamed protein product [Rotaria socialis]CAF4325931.1 unnamed protein product [Rotaria socialis]